MSNETPEKAVVKDSESLSLKDIKAAEQALTQILMAKVDFKLAYRMEKISRKLIAQLEKIENKRLELVTEYGEPELDKEGKDMGRVAVPVAKHKEFNDAFTVYLNSTVDVAIESIPYELLESSGIKFSSADLVTLTKFITEPAVG